MEEEKDEPEENHFDRRRKYRELMASGMTDREASETIWPTSAATIKKNAQDKRDKDAKAAEKKKKED